jgi:hypothetical protein
MSARSSRAAHVPSNPETASARRTEPSELFHGGWLQQLRLSSTNWSATRKESILSSWSRLIRTSLMPSCLHFRS